MNMRIQTMSVAIVLATCVIFGGSAAATDGRPVVPVVGNLLKNGDFECGKLTGWGNCANPGGTTMKVAKGGHGGEWALEYSHNGIGRQAFCRNFVKVTPGAVYTVRGWLRGDAEKINVRLFNYAEGMKYVGETEIYTATKLDAWTPFEKAFSAPTNVTDVGVGLLLVKGTAHLDDVEVVEGNQVAEEPNVLWNSSFKLSYHDNGMPEFWNTGGGYSLRPFQKGVHEGNFFHMADDVASPVEGARVLYVNGIGRTYLRPGPLAGNSDYTFSVYAKSVKGEVKMNLLLSGMKPQKKEFTVGPEWQRLVFTAHLDQALAQATPILEYNRYELHLAAPMLHAGTKALPWKPSPIDATFPDLFAGKQVPPPAPTSPEAVCQKEESLAIFVEYDFYTTEKTARYRLRNAKAPVSVRVERGEKVESIVKGGSGEIAIGDLADGYYEVVVKAANGEARSHFRKFANEKHFTRINRFNETIDHDGKPFFPIMFTVWAGGGEKDKVPTDWHIQELKKHNFNTVMMPPELYSSWDKRNTPEMRKAVAKKFTDAGFKLLVWSACGNLKKEGLMKAVVERRMRDIDELAEFKKDILGWYYLDEIGGEYWEKNFGVKIGDYPRGYRAIKDYDPARLHFINWNHSGCTVGKKYFAEDGATDLYSLDVYTYSHKPSFGSLSEFELGTATLRSRMDDTHLPGIEWLQTYSYMEGIREPHPLEYRNNVYVALAFNVSGYMHFIDMPEHKELWDGMGEAYGTALKWLNMTVEPGSELIRRGRQGQISYALWKHGAGGYAFIAANTLYAPQRERLKGLSGLKGLRGLEIIGGKGDLVVGDGEIVVALPTAGSAAWFFK